MKIYGTQLKIEQTRGQNIVNRLHAESLKLFIGFFIMLLFGLIGSGGPNIELIVMAFIMPLLFTLWLMVFNTGAGKVIEHGLAINEQEITYIHYGNNKSVSWQDYNGFTITKGWFKQIVILSKSHQDIVFDYYTFSKAQRERLLSALKINLAS